MSKFILIFSITFLAVLPKSLLLDNGLALTPPMGWLSWQRFRCVTDCESFPDECINEKLFKDMADRMVADGYNRAGYEYVIIDDCWSSKERDADGRLQADPDRFPGGIKALADYMHSAGLKFGIYGDYGSKTCAGYPGSIDTVELDMQTFSDWGVDYFKMDSCNSNGKVDEGYALTAEVLKNVEHPIVFSCCNGGGTNYSASRESCNLWRIHNDIDDDWGSVKSIAKFVMDTSQLPEFAGPGAWNDPDMLVIGNFGLSLEQSKSQMTMWTIWASPLIMSVDLRTIGPDYRDILQNSGAIEINQDPLGIQGTLQSSDEDIYIWAKPLQTLDNRNNSRAIGLVSFRTDGSVYRKTIQLKDYGLTNADGYTVQNIFDPENSPSHVVKPDAQLIIRMNPSGGVLLRADPKVN